MSDDLPTVPDLQNLELLSVLGRGGMSVVYKARQPLSGRIVAVKLLSDQLLEKKDVLRFEREAKIMAALTHPNIASIFQFGIVPKPYIVMEFLEGGSLAERLSERPLTPPESVAVFSAICYALTLMHDSGIIHRDIKPANIMFANQGDRTIPKLMDFGIAKPAMDPASQSQALTAEGHLIGSPAYMSPEQCAGEELDVRSDVYSLCCVIFESLTGQPLFAGSNALEQMYLHSNSERPSAVDVATKYHLPLSLVACVMKGLTVEKAQRWNSAAELAQELQCAVLTEDRPTRPVRGSLLLKIVTVVLLSGVIYGIANVLEQNESNLLFQPKTAKPRVMRRLPDDFEELFDHLKALPPEQRTTELPIYRKAFDRLAKQEILALKGDLRAPTLHAVLSGIFRLQFLVLGRQFMDAEYKKRLHDPTYKDNPYALAHLKRAMAVEQLRVTGTINPQLAESLLSFDDRELGPAHETTLWDVTNLMTSASKRRNNEQVNRYFDRLETAINDKDSRLSQQTREQLVESIILAVHRTRYVARGLTLVDTQIEKGNHTSPGAEGTLWYLKSLCFKTLKRLPEEEAALGKCIDLSRPDAPQQIRARERLKAIRAAAKTHSFE